MSYIGNEVSAVSADATIYLPVRQTVLIGSSSAGVPNFMAAGTGLRVALSAAATPMAIAFATGFGSYGASDLVSRLSANASDMTGSDLGATNTNYIFATYTNNASVVWGSTLIPPQYGNIYQQNQQSLLKFAGVDASTSIIDDYGNTWTAAGNAQIDTAVQIDTLNTLLLDGTGDYVESTNFTTLGGGSWTLECKVRFNVLPGASSNMVIFSASNATFGAALALNNTAGVFKLGIRLSSNGSSADIASDTVGSSTTYATATTYHVALTYDALAGKYFVYKDGVVDQTITSALRACSTTIMDIGRNIIMGSPVALNGAVAGFRFAPYCRYPNGTTFTPAAVSTYAVEGHWFDTTGYQMYEATTASVVAGTNPTFTTRVRCFVAEADTSGAAVSAVRNYAYQGKYQSADVALPGLGVKITFASNLGSIPLIPPMIFGRNITTDTGYTPGSLALFTFSGVGAGNSTGSGISIVDRNNIAVQAGGTTIFIFASIAGGAAGPLSTSWKMFAVAQRGW